MPKRNGETLPKYHQNFAETKWQEEPMLHVHVSAAFNAMLLFHEKSECSCLCCVPSAWN
jgi:hypothetical protein